MDNVLNQVLDAVNYFDIKVAFSVFVAYVVVDALYAKYTLQVANYNEYKAASTGTIIHFLLAFGVINYTQNWLYIFPLAIGSWIGTFIAVRRSKATVKNNG